MSAATSKVGARITASQVESRCRKPATGPAPSTSRSTTGAAYKVVRTSSRLAVDVDNPYTAAARALAVCSADSGTATSVIAASTVPSAPYSAGFSVRPTTPWKSRFAALCTITAMNSGAASRDKRLDRIDRRSGAVSAVTHLP